MPPRKRRARGYIESLPSGSYRVEVYAGTDPLTGDRLHRLGRKVVGGRPQWLRESDAFRQSGPNLVGKVIIDPGHGCGDPGVATTTGGHREAFAVLRLGEVNL